MKRLVIGACLAGLLTAAKTPAASEPVIQVTAKKFEFAPSTLELKLGVPVILEITSLDRKHGFLVPDLRIEEEITPDKPTRIRIVPDKAGTFAFRCNIFCGGGHEEMTGQIVVKP